MASKLSPPSPPARGKTGAKLGAKARGMLDANGAVRPEMPSRATSAAPSFAKAVTATRATVRNAAPIAARSASPSSDTDPATRERILLEAARRFRHHGFAATTLRDVADAAGIKAGSIYYHFASKDQILAEVLDKGIEVVAAAVRARVDALPSGTSARERIAAAIEGHLWGLLHHGDFTSANIRIYGQIPPAAKERHKLVRRAYADYWDALLRDAQASGELRADSTAAVIRLFVIGALNWTVEWYNPQKGSFADFAAQVTTIVFDGVLKRD